MEHAEGERKAEGSHRSEGTEVHFTEEQRESVRKPAIKGQEHPELPSGDRNCLRVEGVPPGHLGFHEQVRCGQPSCGMAGGSHEHRHRSIERYPQIGRQPLQRDTELVQFGDE